MSITTTRRERLSNHEATELWLEYKRTGDPALRDRLVLTFAPMVKYIVYRKVREIPARCEADDFLSAGLEALIRALDRFEPEKGAALERFLWTRIHGAVLDELRHNDWAPRSLRRWERDIQKARRDFVRLYDRVPGQTELADSLGISREELIERLDRISMSQVGSLNTLVLADDETVIEKVDTLVSTDPWSDPEHNADRSEAGERLHAALEDLPERERKVAVLLYLYNLTLREIGEVIGVSESRVCQIHTQILGKLRTQLDDDRELFAAIAS
jgi:RNA polymerase sigma factor for flagellar operon FliA